MFVQILVKKLHEVEHLLKPHVDQKQRKEMILKWQQELDNWNTDWMVILLDDLYIIMNSEQYVKDLIYGNLLVVRNK